MYREHHIRLLNHFNIEVVFLQFSAMRMSEWKSFKAPKCKRFKKCWTNELMEWYIVSVRNNIIFNEY